MIQIGRMLSGLMVATLIACGQPEAPKEPFFDESSCPFRLHPTQQAEPGPQQTVRCGRLNVLENRDAEHSARIQIPVLVFKSRNPTVPPEVELAGGPGQSWADLGIENITASDIKNLGRDWIFIEQRGTGLSTPSLSCPELDATSMDSMGASMDPLIVCRDRLSASGIDLAAYNTRAMAVDLEQMRTTLGYRRFLLGGVSYGTTWALEYMRQFPDSLDRVLLDSVAPPHVAQFARRSSGRNDALTALFAACQASTSCSSTFPDLETKLIDTIAALEKTPLGWSLVSDGKFTSELYVSTVDEVQMGQPLLLPYFIETVHKTLRAGQTSLDSADPRVQALMMSSSTATASLAIGMHLSVTCAKNQFVTTEDVLADVAKVRPALQPYFKNSELGLLSICRQWKYARFEPSALSPVKSAVPALLLAGALDPRTPPPWAAEAAKTLSRGSFANFPGLSHSVLSTQASSARSCMSQLIGQLIYSGTVADTSCVGLLRPQWILQ